VAGRLSGLAVGTVATTIFGGLTPYVSQMLVHASGSASVPGVIVTAVALAALPVLWCMPETAPRRASQTGDNSHCDPPQRQW